MKRVELRGPYWDPSRQEMVYIRCDMPDWPDVVVEGPVWWGREVVERLRRVRKGEKR